MIITSHSPQGDRNHRTVLPNNAAVTNDIANEPGARFTSTNTDATVIYPKRIFADDPSVENQATARFRLPPRYRNVPDDDCDDGQQHIGKDRPSTKGASAKASSTIPELRNNRHFQEIQIRSQNPTTTAVQYYHNRAQRDVGQVPILTSWTAAATGTTEQGHPTAWRRHYLDDTRRIQTAPVGQGIPGYTDARSNLQHRDRVSSIPPVRHEVLLSDMRSIYTLGASLPSSMTIDPPQPPPAMRHMPSQEMTHIRTMPPTNNDLYSSRTTDVSMNRMNTAASQYAIPGSFNHSDRSMGTTSGASLHCVPSRLPWRHPNGRIYEHIGLQPPVANHESESQLSTNSSSRVMHRHSSNSQHRQRFVENSATTDTSEQIQVVASNRTTQPQYGTATSRQPFLRPMIPQDQPPQQELQRHQKDQPQRQTPVAPSAPPQPPVFEKVKGFDKLDLLCTATLEVGELHDNPTGCSCPKSKCVALYCDCFKAGRRCHPNRCSCYDCKNTIAESGIDGARTKAIRNILARNPRAFNTAGMGNPLHKLPPGEVACNCVRSKCLKLYCSCFHHGKLCRPDVCTCVGCENIISTDDASNGNREAAIQHVIEKRADAFVIKPKVVGQGCACKNNKCLRKYCECYRTGLRCNPNKCTCRDCENRSDNDPLNYPTTYHHSGDSTVLSSDVSEKISV